MDKKKTGISRLIEVTGKWKGLLILGCILSAISAVVSLGPFVCIYFVVKEIIEAGGNLNILDVDKVIGIGWIALALAIIGFILYFSALMCTHITAFNTIKRIKLMLLHHLATLSLGFHSINPSGKIRKIIETNSEQTEGFIAHRLPDVVGAITTPITIFVLFLIFDWRLGLLCLAPIVIGFAIQMSMLNGETEQKFLRNYQSSLEDMNNSAVEYVRGISVVKVFGQTIYSFKNFFASIMKYKDFVVKYALSMERPMTLFTTITNATFFFLIPGGVILSRLTIDYESFVLSFIFYVIFTPVTAVMLMKLMYTSSDQMLVKESLRRIDEILDEKPLEEVKNPLKPKNSSIEFKNVSFTYEGSKTPAISNISLKVKEGSIVALVGGSGGGKTTIANLIARFWDVDKGSISIGNVDVRNINNEDLMDYVSIVFQDVHLFKTSILENIRFSNPRATREEVLRAAEAAQCNDILEKLPNGIDTVIGSNGVYLSGGEAQRVALARTILKDSPIIILDEATAFADPENEYKIQLALNKLIKGKTVIMIAHRLSSIKKADKIIVLENGKIIEEGNHNNLIENNKIYSKMWRDYQLGLSWGIGKEVANV